MKVIHGLSLASTEGLDVALECDAELHPDHQSVTIEVSGDNFNVDLNLQRRQCRELRDWLNAVLDD